jgi:hypothetical protein
VSASLLQDDLFNNELSLNCSHQINNKLIFILGKHSDEINIYQNKTITKSLCRLINIGQEILMSLILVDEDNLA